MLQLTIAETEVFDEVNNVFVEVQAQQLELEHSLFSVSKWESEFEKPFLSDEEKTSEEIMAYAHHMIVTPGVPREVVLLFTQENFKTINEYVGRKHTATTFGDLPKKGGRGETITSELIYYWMVAYTIPFECEHWHLNRLFALVRICNVKNQPEKKMSKHEIAMRNRQLNEQRRAKYDTKG